MASDKDLLQSLAALPIGVIILLAVAMLSLAMVLSSAFLSFGLIGFAGIIGLTIFAVIARTPEERPRVPIKAVSKPKVIGPGRYKANQVYGRRL